MSVNISVFGRYLLERDFPGMRIGPEPTTDNFHVIEWAEEEGKIPGTAWPSLPDDCRLAVQMSAVRSHQGKTSVFHCRKCVVSGLHQTLPPSTAIRRDVSQQVRVVPIKL